jgi:polar amino acid transport system substrate-binding protein
MKTVLAFAAVLLLPAAPAGAGDVRVAFGASLPPYVIKQDNSGIEYDIIKEALAHRGHTLVPVYMPFVEIKDALAERRADAVATVKETVGIEGSFSDEVVVYQNFAISLASRKLSVRSQEDLRDKKIVAFQLATQYLGSLFAEIAHSNPYYREKSDQLVQARLLFEGKADAIISDKNIFLHFTRQLPRDVDTEQAVVYHDIFPANPYKVAFLDGRLRDEFNLGLRNIRDSGAYQDIIKKYTLK